MAGYDTNLAAEFFVLSMLHRQGFDATLTLGNKKAIDIVVLPRGGMPVTIDVKGLAGKTGWPVDNLKTAKPGHFIVFVCFLGKIEDPTVLPEVYVIPSNPTPCTCLQCSRWAASGPAVQAQRERPTLQRFLEALEKKGLTLTGRCSRRPLSGVRIGL